MSKIQDAVALAKQWAADSSHGYDQSSRWGPDYDCSSFIIAVLEQSGIKVKSAGATYTGNMRAVFQRCGFEVITSWTVSTLQPGDILLNEANHTAMYIGNGQLVQARSNENGGTTGGKSGDQTGREIAVSAYYSYPWDCVLRYREAPSVGSADSSPIATQQGSQEKQKEKTMNEDNTYIVKSGDTLWSICGGDYSRVNEVARLNGIDPNRIYPGQALKLWADAPVQTEAAPAEEKKLRFGQKIVKGMAKAMGGRVEF